MNEQPASSSGPSRISVQGPSQLQSQSQTSSSLSEQLALLNSYQNHSQPCYSAQQNVWQNPVYRYSSGAAPYQQYRDYVQPYPQYQHQQQLLWSPQTQTPSQPLHNSGHGQRNSTPSPLPEFHHHWDAVVASFLSDLGLTQALRGFENDILVMNEDWERQKVPKAVGELIKDLMSLGQSPNIDRKERSLEERKFDYAHFAQDTKSRSQTSINKTISAFLAQNRARNNDSNRAEFLQSLSNKSRKLLPDMSNPGMASIPESNSCARTNAKTLDRDVQMKYDIARNEEGPLRRTVKVGVPFYDDLDLQRQAIGDGGNSNKELYAALDERLLNLETHLSVRYVPSSPRSLLDRLKFLEDHIIRLEKEYPPWAALHFNQPYRGWPAPPRPTPIIVPSHLTSAFTEPRLPTPVIPKSAQSSQGTSSRGKGKHSRSSLHRAVMERLEVQEAMNDLAGRRSSNVET